MTDEQKRYRLPYEKIVMAYLETCALDLKGKIEKGSGGGGGGYWRPALSEITRDMDGILVLYDLDGCRWKIKTDLLRETAGEVLIELSLRAPYILLGDQSYLDENEEEDWMQAVDMVKVMRECSKGS